MATGEPADLFLTEAWKDGVCPCAYCQAELAPIDEILTDFVVAAVADDSASEVDADGGADANADVDVEGAAADAGAVPVPGAASGAAAVDMETLGLRALTGLPPTRALAIADATRQLGSAFLDYLHGLRQEGVTVVRAEVRCRDWVDWVAPQARYVVILTLLAGPARVSGRSRPSTSRPLCSGSAVENSVIAAWMLPPIRSGISAPPER